MTVKTDAAWQPGWAVHPGAHLAEYLEARGLTQADFARLAGMTPKLISTIIGGTNPVTPETALKLEHVLGLKAYIWLGLQRDWDLAEARREAADKAVETSSWLARFPIRELKAVGALPDSRDPGVLADALMSFLAVGAPDRYAARLSTMAVRHRRSKHGQTSPEHELCWLMLGEAKVRELDLPMYDAEKFRRACEEIGKLTRLVPEQFEPLMSTLCRDAGVALVFQKPISKTCIFGSARWVDGRIPFIQMSLRMKSNDHFWWTFFHEAGHLMLHGGRNFVDDEGGIGDECEGEADLWAEEMLVGRESLAGILESDVGSKAAVRRHADMLGLHPGILVGMLQHRGAIPFNHMNDLKDRFEWADEVQPRRSAGLSPVRVGLGLGPRSG